MAEKILPIRLGIWIDKVFGMHDSRTGQICSRIHAAIENRNANASSNESCAPGRGRIHRAGRVIQTRTDQVIQRNVLDISVGCQFTQRPLPSVRNHLL